MIQLRTAGAVSKETALLFGFSLDADFSVTFGVALFAPSVRSFTNIQGY
jgi:hypothetical protein